MQISETRFTVTDRSIETQQQAPVERCPSVGHYSHFDPAYCRSCVVVGGGLVGEVE